MVTIKPNWDNAPEWAKYWAMDSDGSSFWFEKKPKLTLSGDYATGFNNYEQCGYQSEVLITGTTMEERPVATRNINQPISASELGIGEPKVKHITLGDVREIMTAGIETKLDRIIELLEKEQEADLDDLLTLAGVRPPEM